MTRYHLLIDADDTLWENNIYYERAIEDFISFVDHSQLSRDEIRAVLDEVEHGMGYGSASFTKSLLETYRRVHGANPQANVIGRVRGFGESVGTYPIQLLEGVLETLQYLQPRHDLVLLTKGNHDEQTGKVDRSGIKEIFRAVVVVPEKDVDAYRRVVSELSLDPQRTWMIGNSPRSDINPALGAGLRAVFIPHPHTWRLEHAEVLEDIDGRLLQLAKFAELKGHF